MDLETLINKVNNHFGCDIKEDTRERQTVMARACYYWLAINTTKCSKSKIGRSVGRDHAGVIYSLRHLNDWIAFDDFFKVSFEELKYKVLTEYKKGKIDPQNLVYKYNILLIENDILKKEVKMLKEKLL